MTPPKSARERDEEAYERLTGSKFNRTDRGPVQASGLSGFMAGRSSLRAEYEKNYAIIPKVHHENDKALYVMQTEQMTKMRAKMAEVSDLMANIKALIENKDSTIDDLAQYTNEIYQLASLKWGAKP